MAYPWEEAAQAAAIPTPPPPLPWEEAAQADNAQDTPAPLPWEEAAREVPTLGTPPAPVSQGLESVNAKAPSAAQGAKPEGDARDLIRQVQERRAPAGGGLGQPALPTPEEVAARRPDIQPLTPEALQTPEQQAATGRVQPVVLNAEQQKTADDLQENARLDLTPMDQLSPEDRRKWLAKETEAFKRDLAENPGVKPIIHLLGDTGYVGKLANALVHLTDGRENYSYLDVVQQAQKDGAFEEDGVARNFFLNTLPKLLADSPVYIAAGSRVPVVALLPLLNAAEQGLDAYNLGAQFDLLEFGRALVGGLTMGAAGKLLGRWLPKSGGAPKRLATQAGRTAGMASSVTAADALYDQLTGDERVREQLTPGRLLERFSANLLTFGAFEFPQYVRAGLAGRLETELKTRGVDADFAADLATTAAYGRYRKDDSGKLVPDEPLSSAEVAKTAARYRYFKKLGLTDDEVRGLAMADNAEAHAYARYQAFQQLKAQLRSEGVTGEDAETLAALALQRGVTAERILRVLVEDPHAVSKVAATWRQGHVPRVGARPEDSSAAAGPTAPPPAGGGLALPPAAPARPVPPPRADAETSTSDLPFDPAQPLTVLEQTPAGAIAWTQTPFTWVHNEDGKNVYASGADRLRLNALARGEQLPPPEPGPIPAAGPIPAEKISQPAAATGPADSLPAPVVEMVEGKMQPEPPAGARVVHGFDEYVWNPANGWERTAPDGRPLRATGTLHDELMERWQKESGQPAQAPAPAAGLPLAALQAPAGSAEQAAASAGLDVALQQHIAESGKQKAETGVSQKPAQALRRPAAASATQVSALSELTKLERMGSLVGKGRKWLAARQALLQSEFDRELAKPKAEQNADLQKRLGAQHDRLVAELEGLGVTETGANIIRVDDASKFSNNGMTLATWRERELLPLLKEWSGALEAFRTFADDALKRVRQGDFGKQLVATPDWMQTNAGTPMYFIYNAGKIIAHGEKPSGLTFGRLAELVRTFTAYLENGQLARPFTNKQMDGLKFLWDGFVEQSGAHEARAERVESGKRKAESGQPAITAADIRQQAEANPWWRRPVDAVHKAADQGDPQAQDVEAQIAGLHQKTPLDTPEILHARRNQLAQTETVRDNSPERITIRENVVKSYLAKFTAAKREGRIFIIMGLPSSGKSKVIADRLLKDEGAMLVDADEVKKLLPGYARGEFAGTVHHESAALAEGAILRRAFVARANVVLSLVGYDAEKIGKLLDEIGRQHYHAELYFVELPVEEAMRRTVKRFVEGEKNADGTRDFRFVDPANIQKYGLQPLKNYGKFKQRDEVRKYEHYDNAVPFGTPPRLVDSQTKDAGNGGSASAAGTAAGRTGGLGAGTGAVDGGTPRPRADDQGTRGPGQLTGAPPDRRGDEGAAPAAQPAPLTPTPPAAPGAVEAGPAPETPKAAEVNAAAHEAATSPQNNLTEPTPDQKDAGNYKKGHVRVNGLDVTLENPAGSKRRPEWNPLQDHYGYIKRTEGKDGDHVDVFVNPANPESERVFVVNQKNPDTGRFDEHKVMLGYANRAAAIAAYKRNYQPGWKGLDTVADMTLDQFKAWLANGDTTKPAPGGEPPAEKPAGDLFQAPAAAPADEYTNLSLPQLKDRAKLAGLKLVGAQWNQPNVLRAALRKADQEREFAQQQRTSKLAALKADVEKMPDDLRGKAPFEWTRAQWETMQEFFKRAVADLPLMGGEYNELTKAFQARYGFFPTGQSFEHRDWPSNARHEVHVALAILRGDTIPADVLKDYPPEKMAEEIRYDLYGDTAEESKRADAKIMDYLRRGHAPAEPDLNAAISAGRPVNAAAVDAAGIKLPTGWVLKGENYVQEASGQPEKPEAIQPLEKKPAENAPAAAQPAAEQAPSLGKTPPAVSKPRKPATLADMMNLPPPGGWSVYDQLPHAYRREHPELDLTLSGQAKPLPALPDGSTYVVHRTLPGQPQHPGYRVLLTHFAKHIKQSGFGQTPEAAFDAAWTGFVHAMRKAIPAVESAPAELLAAFDGNLSPQKPWRPGEAQAYFAKLAPELERIGYTAEHVGSTSDPALGSDKDMDVAVTPQEGQNVGALVELLAKKAYAWWKDEEDLFSFYLPNGQKLEVFIKGIADDLEKYSEEPPYADWATKLMNNGLARTGGQPFTGEAEGASLTHKAPAATPVAKPSLSTAGAKPPVEPPTNSGTLPPEGARDENEPDLVQRGGRPETGDVADVASQTQPGRDQPGGRLGGDESGEAQGAGSLRPTAPAGAGSAGTGVPSAPGGGAGRQHPSVASGNQLDLFGTEPRPHVSRQNYVLTAADNIGKGGLRSKFNDNLAAIQLLKKIEADGRPATMAEQKVLARYVGWGGLKGVFVVGHKEWGAAGDELRTLLTPAEYEAAQRSILDAHYTSPTIITRGIYAAFKRFGFTGGKMVEGGSGIGHFIGFLPAEWRNVTSYVGVELDPLTARIARLLYPQATIHNMGFQEAELKPGTFDGSAGNPPFGETGIYDKNFKHLNRFSIHNYFLGKQVDLLRPGGIGGFVVSHYFLDAIDSAARDYLASQARFLGAIRLPNTAFKENANTEVTTDLVFFQKLPAGEHGDTGWTKVVPWKDEKSGLTFKVNQWIVGHPAMILGDMGKAKKGLYNRDELGVNGRDGQDLGADLDRAVAALPEKIYQAVSLFTQQRLSTPEEIEVPDVKVGGYFLSPNGAVLRRVADENMQRRYAPAELKKGQAERIALMVPLRDTLNELVRAELSDETPADELDSLRRRLNAEYDRFVKKFGYLNQPFNRRAFYDDPQSARLLGLETDFDAGLSRDAARKQSLPPRDPSAKKAAIFAKRVNQPYHEITHVETSAEALAASLNQRGLVDLDYMAELSGKSAEDLQRDLQGLIFKNPRGGWEGQAKYLSGDVRTKLEEAKSAAENDPAYQANVAALEKVIPADIPASKIRVPLGAGWVPASDLAQFAVDLVGKAPAVCVYVRSNGGWMFELRGGDPTLVNRRWGTPRAGFGELLKDMLNGKVTVIGDYVKDANGSEHFVKDEPATMEALNKANELRDAWRDWIFKDQERRNRLTRIYNDTINRYVDPKHDGSHLTLPGVNQGITLRQHQKNAIWRIITDTPVMLDHVVGAGKTFAMIGGLMELRRMGRVRKPLFAVPNHLVTQWRDEFLRLYPNANVLYAQPADFQKDRRQRLFAKIMTGDYDAVILGHSSLKKIGVSVEEEKRLLNEMLDEIVQTIKEMKDAERGAGRKRSSRQTAQMEKTKENLQAKLQALADVGKRDDVATFEELGIDALVVDEYHELGKNLFYTTQKQNIAGLGSPQGSDKAFDLYLKTRYLQHRFGGKAPMVFATGTPISNSLVEMFTLQRYLQPDVLDKMNIKTLDAWANVFGDIRGVYEVDPTGTGYRMQTRFASFLNVGELAAVYRSMADVITQKDLMAQAEAEGKRFPIPKIQGGKPAIHAVERTPEQAAYFGVERQKLGSDGQPAFDSDGNPVMEYPQGTILWRVDNMPDDPRQDNMLKLTNDARRAGLDMRLVHPSAPDRPESKVNEAVRNILRIHAATAADKGAQLVFCDLSVPSSAKEKIAQTVFYRDQAGDINKGSGRPVKLADAPEWAEFVAVERPGESKADSGWIVVERHTGSIVAADHARAAAVKQAQAAKLDGKALEKLYQQRGDLTDDLVDAWLEQQRAAAEANEEAAAESNDEQAVSMDELLASGSEFSVYDDVRAKLVKAGVPAAEVAFIHDYDTPDKKAKLFAAVRTGQVRVLIGSTPRMGAGMNVQDRLVALHHLDAPWRPSDLEQREGRILRQGNKLYERDPDGFQVEIHRYATKQSYDTRMWQLIEHKAGGIEGFRQADHTVRELEDFTGEAANAADMKAAASGDPRIQREMQLRNELQQLELLKQAYNNNRYDMEERRRWLALAPDRHTSIVDALRADVAQRDAYPVVEKELNFVTPDGDVLKDTKGLLIRLQVAFKRALETGKAPLGSYRGFDLAAWGSATGVAILAKRQNENRAFGAEDIFTRYGVEDKLESVGFMARVNNLLKSFEDRIADADRVLAKAQRELADMDAELAKPFARAAELEAKRREHSAVRQELMNAKKKPSAVSGQPSAGQPNQPTPPPDAAAGGPLPDVGAVAKFSDLTGVGQPPYATAPQLEGSYHERNLVEAIQNATRSVLPDAGWHADEALRNTWNGRIDAARTARPGRSDEANQRFAAMSLDVRFAASPDFRAAAVLAARQGLTAVPVDTLGGHSFGVISGDTIFVAADVPNGEALAVVVHEIGHFLARGNLAMLAHIGSVDRDRATFQDFFVWFFKDRPGVQEIYFYNACQALGLKPEGPFTADQWRAVRHQIEADLAEEAAVSNVAGAAELNPLFEGTPAEVNLRRALLAHYIIAGQTAVRPSALAQGKWLFQDSPRRDLLPPAQGPPAAGAGEPPPPPPVATAASPADDPNNPNFEQHKAMQAEMERLRNEVKAAEAARQSAFSAGFKAKLGAKKRGKADFDSAMDEMHSIMEKVGAAAEAPERGERVRLGAQAVREAMRSGQHAERRGAASKLAEISGESNPASGQTVPPTAASIVRATWNKAQKEGFLRGAAAHGSFHSFLEAALDRRAQFLQRRKASEKIALWESELERIESARRALQADPDAGREIVRQLLLGADGQRGLVQGADYHRILAAKNLAPTDLLAGLRAVMEDRVTDHYITDIQKLLGREDARPWNIAAIVKPEYDRLMETVGPIWNGLQALYAAEDRLKHLRDTGATPEAIERQNDRLDGLRTAFAAALEDPQLLKRFADFLMVDNPRKADSPNDEKVPARIPLAQAMPEATTAEILAALHDEVASVLARSDNAKYMVVEGHKLEIAEVSATVHGEMEQGAKLMHGGQQGEAQRRTRPWLGRYADAHKGIHELLIYLTGRAESQMERILYRAMQRGETARLAMNHAEREAFSAEVKRLGLSIVDVWRWVSKKQTYTFRVFTGVRDGQPQYAERELILTDAEAMDLWNLIKNEDVVGLLDRSPLKAWNDRGKPNARFAVHFGAGRGTEAVREIRRVLQEQLSDAQRALADYLFARANAAERREALNEQSRRESGVDNFTMHDRWALSVDRSASPLVTPADELQRLMSGGVHAGMDTGRRNRRIKHSNPLLVRNVFDTFFEDVDWASSYAHMRQPVLNALALLRFNAAEGAGSIRADVESRLGQQPYQFILKQIGRAAGYIKVQRQGFDRTWDVLASNAAVAILWGRMSSVLNNRLGGSALMLSELAHEAPGLALNYLRRLLTIPPGVARLSKRYRDAIALLKSQSGYLGVRWGEHYRAAVGNFLEGAEASEGGNVGFQRWRKLQEAGLKPMEWAEQRNAADAFLALRASGMGEAEAVQRVEQMTRDTQNTSSALDESQFSQAIKENRVLWFLFPFFSQVAVSGRLWQRDALLFAAAQGFKEKAKAARNWSFTTWGLLISAVLSAVIYRLFAAAQRDEKFVPEDERKAMDLLATAAANMLDNTAPGTGRAMDVVMSAVERGQYRDPNVLNRAIDAIVVGSRKLLTADQVSFDDPKFFDGMSRIGSALTALGGIPFSGPAQSVKAVAGLSGHPLVGEGNNAPPAVVSAPYARPQERAPIRRPQIIRPVHPRPAMPRRAP